jgi:hypothetical protein
MVYKVFLVAKAELLFKPYSRAREPYSQPGERERERERERESPLEPFESKGL